MVRSAAFCAVLAAVTGCGDFETPSIVLDLRFLGARAEPAEVVTPIDPDDPMNVVLEEVEVCALIADPADDRRLAYDMVACAPRGSLRCDEPTAPFVPVGFGTVDDPETADDEVRMCGTIPATGGILAVLEEAIRSDSLSGFGGVEVQVEMVAYPEGGSIDDGIFAKKTVLYAPKFPEERVANQNPDLERFTVKVDGGEPIDLPMGRCGEVEPLEVSRDSELEIEPVEPDGAREEYVLPTFDGGSRTFTENLSYAWFATAGEWSSENTGGPRDFAGNQPPLDSTFTASLTDEQLGDGADVRLWIVQRDERGGQSWYHACVRVVP